MDAHQGKKQTEKQSPNRAPLGKKAAGKGATATPTPEKGKGKSKERKAKGQGQRKPFPLEQRIWACIHQHDLKRYALYKIAPVEHLKEYPGVCEFLKISPEATPIQVAAALLQQPEFAQKFKIFKAGGNFLMGRQFDLAYVINRVIYSRCGVRYQELLGQIPVSKLTLDRFLREQIQSGKFIRGACYDDQKKWYPIMPRIENPIVDLWKYVLTYFAVYPRARIFDLIHMIKKEYFEISPPALTMRRVVAELGHEGKLKYSEGKWTVLEEGFVVNKKYLKRNPKLGKKQEEGLSS